MTFGIRAKFHIVKLSEREIGMSNWPLNMEVVDAAEAIGILSVNREGAVSQKCLHIWRAR